MGTSPPNISTEILHSIFLFRHYFQLPHWYNHPGRPLRSAHKNMDSTLLYPEIIEDYLEMEVTNHQVSGPYDKNSCLDALLVHLGLSPYAISRVNGDWLLIFHILSITVLMKEYQNTYVVSGMWQWMMLLPKSLRVALIPYLQTLILNAHFAFCQYTQQIDISSQWNGISLYVYIYIFILIPASHLDLD